jgi:hypothetical protein
MRTPLRSTGSRRPPSRRYQAVCRFWLFSAVIPALIAIAIHHRGSHRPAENTEKVNNSGGAPNRALREVCDSLLQSLQGLILRIQAVKNTLPSEAGKATAALDEVLVSGDRVILAARDAMQRDSSVDEQEL